MPDPLPIGPENVGPAAAAPADVPPPPPAPALPASPEPPGGVGDSPLQLATECYNAAGAPVPAGAAQLPADTVVAVPPEQAMGPLTVQQASAVELLVAGASDARAAKAVKAHRVTVTRWRLYNFHFQAELNRRRQEVWGSAADGVRGLLATAVKVIRRQLKSDDPATAFRAARAVLALAGAGKFAPEDAPADPMALLDAAARPKHVERRAAERGDDPTHEPVTDADRLAALNDLARRMKALLKPKELNSGETPPAGATKAGDGAGPADAAPPPSGAPVTGEGQTE